MYVMKIRFEGNPFRENVLGLEMEIDGKEHIITEWSHTYICGSIYTEVELTPKCVVWNRLIKRMCEEND